MRRGSWGALAALGLVVGAGLVAAPAHAAPGHGLEPRTLTTTAPGTYAPSTYLASADEPVLLTAGRQILRYDVSVELDADGTARVEIDMDFRFGTQPGRGPYIWLPTRVGYNEEYDRLYPVRDIWASSATGAPDRVNLDRSSSAVTVRIGEENRANISGTQQYTIGYTVEGLMNSAAATGGLDEFYWNVIGDGWEIPITNVSVTVTGPADVAATGCFAGPAGVADECGSHAAAGPAATFTESEVPVGRLVTVVAGWPAGTFTGIEPILAEPLGPLDVVRPGPVTGPLALVIAIGGMGLALHRLRTRGRDEAYLGLTPGVAPLPGQSARLGVRDRRAPVAVQFTPPEGFRPGEIGTLVDEKADPHDVTATIVDLAVRGYLRIDEVPRKNPKKPAKDWTLVQLRPADSGLLAFERRLLDAIFLGRSQVTLSDLRTTFAATMSRVQKDLYTEVTGRGWFRSDPRVVRGRWYTAAFVLAVAAPVGVGILAAVTDGVMPRGFLLPVLALLLVAVVVGIGGRFAPARTAAGTAVLAQTLGFRQYLTTAEANQLRYEEGEDLFSRYLPYAVAFGVAERWAKVFADLAAQGAPVAEPTWYTGAGFVHGSLWARGAGFSGAVAAFSTTATTSIAAPTPGSSGGSGFSGGGGGGFSGGGGGGGGGGGW